jgi:Phytanoyl-CoA dioxygenase (PhyH)
LARLLDASEVAATAADVAQLRANRAVGSCERPNNTLVPLRWNDEAVARVLSDAARLGRISAATGGTDLRWTSAYLSIKDPESGPLWWHQDWWCWDHPATLQPNAPQIAVLCYLHDTSVSSGALRVLPGSHASSVDLHATLPDAHRLATLDPDDEALRDQPGQLTIDVRAGDAVVLDYRLLHGTHANTDHRHRDCMILNFAPAWRDLPDDIRAHLIRSPSLPTADEVSDAAHLTPVLPSYAGAPRDLTLVRDAPPRFAVSS